MTYEGCYIDDASRDLPNRWWNTDEMTLELCASHCTGYTFMATQVSIPTTKVFNHVQLRVFYM